MGNKQYNENIRGDVQAERESRWNAYINNMLKGMTPRQAYEAVAGWKSKGYDATTASRNLLKNPRFKKMYDEAQAQARKAAILTKTRIIEEECRIAFSDLALTYDVDGVTSLPPNMLPKDIRRAVKDYTVINHKEVAEDGSTAIRKEYKYRFWSKSKALERVSKHLGLYEKDNRQKSIQGGDGVTIKAIVVEENEG